MFPPVVSTVSARAGGRGAATLTGTVNPFGQAVTACRFEYGTSSMYGSSVPCGSLPAAGEHSVCVSAPVFGLAAHTTYHFRIVATTAGGTSYGLDLEFTTASALAGHLPPLGHQPRRPSEWRWSLRHRWQPRAG